MAAVLLQNLNWNTIFYINVPLCIIAMVLGILFLDESFDSKVSKEIDVYGMILLTVSLFCITFGLLKGSDYGWTSYAIIILFISFVVSTILFLIVESKVSQPMLPLNLFKEITFSASCICYVVVGFGIASPLLILNTNINNAVNKRLLVLRNL